MRRLRWRDKLSGPVEQPTCGAGRLGTAGLWHRHVRLVRRDAQATAPPLRKTTDNIIAIWLHKKNQEHLRHFTGGSLATKPGNQCVRFLGTRILNNNFAPKYSVVQQYPFTGHLNRRTTASLAPCRSSSATKELPHMCTRDFIGR